MQIKQMKGSTKGGKNRANMMILNLALVRRQDWENLVARETRELIEESEQFSEGRWMYHGEMEQMFGIKQALDFIDKGQWERGRTRTGTPSSAR